jgi:hypothetical protein
MFINIIGFVGIDSKEQKQLLKETEKLNKKEYKKYLKAQNLLDGIDS